MRNEHAIKNYISVDVKTNIVIPPINMKNGYTFLIENIT